MSIKNPQTVVVPIDFSKESIAAIDTALSLVKDPSQVHVVHVLPSLSPVEIGVAWEMVDDDRRIHEVKQSIADRLSDKPARGVHVSCLIGEAGDEIVEEAARLEADLIIMPSHGRRGVKRLLLGSVAERVLRLAHCPVLVLKSGKD